MYSLDEAQNSNDGVDAGFHQHENPSPKFRDLACWPYLMSLS